jgi:hypothetical protein
VTKNPRHLECTYEERGKILPPRIREEVAAFAATQSDQLLRRIRGKVRAARAAGLGGPHAASRLDEEDILSSVVRRLDAAAAEGKLWSGDGAAWWGYVSGITQHVIQQRLREGARDLRLFAALSDSEKCGIESLARAELNGLAPLLRGALSDEEWAMLVLRARGQEGCGLAAAAGVSEVTVRKRWSRVLVAARKAITGSSPPIPRNDGK